MNTQLTTMRYFVGFLDEISMIAPENVSKLLNCAFFSIHCCHLTRYHSTLCILTSGYGITI